MQDDERSIFGEHIIQRGNALVKQIFRKLNNLPAFFPTYFDFGLYVLAKTKRKHNNVLKQMKMRRLKPVAAIEKEKHQFQLNREAILNIKLIRSRYFAL